MDEDPTRPRLVVDSTASHRRVVHVHLELAVVRGVVVDAEFQELVELLITTWLHE